MNIHNPYSAEFLKIYLKSLMVGHGGSSAGSYLADPTSPIPSHCALIVTATTLRVNIHKLHVMIYQALKNCFPTRLGQVIFQIDK